MAPAVLGVLELLLAVQAGPAAIAGSIRDGETGSALADAVVTLTDLGKHAVSDPAGRYRIEDVPAGPQHLHIKRIGYSPRTVHALVPGEGRLDLDLSLRPLPLELPPIVVRSLVAVRGVETADSTPFPDRGIASSAIRNHPSLAEPDALLALGGGEAMIAPEAPTGVHLRGGASDHTAYLLDGVPIFSPYHAAGTFSAWNPDVLARVQVTAASPALAPTDALSGAIVASTRTPGSELQMLGTVSTTHARVTALGPLGRTGAGFLLSARSGSPGLIAPEDDPSYLRGRTGDILVKLEAPAFGGQLRLLGYGSGNEIDVAARTDRPDSTAPARRNAFEWGSRSIGVEWSRRNAGGTTIRLRGWSAQEEAEAGWHPADRPSLGLASDRDDEGLLALAERTDGLRFSGAGVRLQRSWTAYRIGGGPGTGIGTSLRDRQPLATVFVRHRRPLRRSLTGDMALAITGATGDVHFGGQAELRWRPWRAVGLSASAARSHQFSQSLRNSESVVGGIFPADLFLGAGVPGVPVGQADRAILAAELLVGAGVRLVSQAYLSDLSGLLLVAPSSGEPFATGEFTTGSGTTRGVSMEAAVTGARYGLTASYGWQRVRLEYGHGSFAPGYGASHSVEGGAIVFPGPTASIRIGVSGVFGRRSTGLLGAFDWESCNLLDQGCEFSGSPTHDIGSLGGTRLPDYVRLDLGLRKHWHLSLGGRDLELAVFGTVTNLLGRRNVLAVATNPVTGRRTEIAMRPLAPLVLGMDWRF